MNKHVRRHFNARALQAYDTGPAALAGLRVRNAAKAGDPVEIMIYDYIGDDGWGGGVTAGDMVSALASAGGAPVTVRINSPGGDVFDGMAIYNAMRGYGGTLNTVVDGIAASAASFIALAGATVTMGEQSMMMIHCASTLAYGNAVDFNAAAGVLAKIDGQIADIYSQKTGKPTDSLMQMMQAETFMTGAEAKAMGFCDTVMAPAAKPEPPPSNVAPPAPVACAETVARMRMRLRGIESESV